MTANIDVLVEKKIRIIRPYRPMLQLPHQKKIFGLIFIQQIILSSLDVLQANISTKN